jgi:hypothetical protein
MRKDLAFTAYNRVDYMEQVIDSWNKTRHIESWRAHFYIEPSELQIHMVDRINKLQAITVTHINETKLGVLVNPWQAIDDRFNDGAEFVVLAEDDVVVSSDSLSFLEWASETYKDDESVLAVNLFSQIGGSKENQVTRDGKFSPLVWGIWKNRWLEHLKDTWDKDYSSGKPDGSEAGWDWNINRILTKSGMDIIKPLQSRSDHIGEFGGTHMTPDLFDSSRGIDFKLARGRQIYTEV